MSDFYSIFYSIPYLIVVMLISFAAKFEMDIRYVYYTRKIHNFVFLTLLLFLGLRGFVAWDWYVYFGFFRDSPTIFNLSINDFLLFIDKNDIVEPFFVVYTALIKTFTSNWNVFVFMSVLIDLIVLNYLFKKHSTNYAFSFLLFFALNMSLEFDLMRNIKALILILISLKYIKERKLFKFLALVFLAFLFHRSALFFIPLYFLANIELKKKTLTFFLIAINILYFIDFSFFKYVVEQFADLLSGQFGGAFADKIYWYSKSEVYSAERGFTLGYFYRNISFILIIMYSQEIYKNYNYGKIMINAMIIYMTVSFVFNDFSVFVNRTEILFAFSFWFLWPYIIDSITDYKFKSVVFAGMILFVFLRTYKQTNNIMYEYENVIFKSRSYEKRVESHFNRGYKLLNNIEKK